MNVRWVCVFISAHGDFALFVLMFTDDNFLRVTILDCLHTQHREEIIAASAVLLLGFFHILLDLCWIVLVNFS